MNIPAFSRKPEQLSLFKVPLRARLKSQLKSLPVQLLLTTALIVEFVKVLGFAERAVEIYRFGRMFGYWSAYRATIRSGEGQESLWFFWLVFMIFVLYLAPRGYLGDKRPTAYAKLLVSGALFIYLLEITLAAYKSADIFASFSVHWSLYVSGVCLAILTLWKLPALQLAQWKDKLEAKDYLTIVNGTRTILLQIVGGAIIIAGLYYTSQNMSIAQENVRLSMLKEEADRLSQAINQLKDENPEVRLVAIHNLQTIATKSVSNYRLIATIFKRYVRVRAAWHDTQDQPDPEAIEARADIQSIIYFLGSYSNVVEALKNDNARRGNVRNLEVFEEAEMRRIIGEVDFHATDLRGLVLPRHMNGWELSSAHLEKSKVMASHLRKAVLENANLSESDLTDADLSSAILKGANLSKATLKDVDLSGADIEGADFTDAINLTVEQIRKAKNYDKAKLPPDISAELSQSMP